MYTGIVTHQGTVVVHDRREDGTLRLEVEVAPRLRHDDIGESIAVDGVCLTVVERHGDDDTARYAFDAIPETLERTTLGEKASGDRVHIEAPLRAGDPLGGHLVQGHVHDTGRIVAADDTRREGELRLTVAAPAGLRDALLPKGCIAVDGVSLTVGEVRDAGDEDPAYPVTFDLHLIPHTLAVTHLGALEPGDRVNLEPDMMAVQVAHMVRAALDRMA